MKKFLQKIALLSVLSLLRLSAETSTTKKTFSGELRSSLKFSAAHKKSDDDTKSLTAAAGTFSAIKFSRNTIVDFNVAAGCRDFLQSQKEYSSVWGTSFLFFKTTLPLTFRTGSISASRSISRLKNPAFTPAGSAAGRTFTFSTGLSSSLPSLSSAEKPLSCFASVDFSKKGLPLDLAFFFTPDSVFCGSAATKINFSKVTSFQLCTTAGRFYLESGSTLLKKNNISFSPDWFNAASLELCFTSPVFKFSAYSGLHENPYGINVWWLRSKSRVILGPFLTDFSFFVIPTTEISPKACPLIAADSSLVKTVEMIEVNPEILFFTKNGTVTIGACASEAWKIAGSTEVSTLNVLKLNGTLLYQSALSSLKFNFTADNWLLYGIPVSVSVTPQKCYGFSTDYKKRLDKVNLTAGISAKQYPPSAKNENLLQKISLSSGITFSKKINFSATAAASFELENGEKSGGDLSFGASIKFKNKWTSTAFRLSLKSEI